MRSFLCFLGAARLVVVFAPTDLNAEVTKEGTSSLSFEVNSKQ
jgi:hypothetical protein